MNSYARVVESVRRTRNTLYLVAGLYIVIGFVVATATAMQRDRLGTFLGFLIISGALSMGLIARTALQVLVRIAHIQESLDDLSERVDGLMPLVRTDESTSGTSAPIAESVLDLANIGVGDPQLLAAATLDRDVYPRLATALEQVAVGGPEAEQRHAPLAEPDGAKSSNHAPGNGVGGVSVTTRDLLRQWKAALADEDLSQCKRVLSAIVDLADHDAVVPLRRQIRELEDRVERKLRERFTHQVHSRDFMAAMETGERICSLLGDRPVAADFERLRPILTRRADEALAVSATVS
jgi:hypothetical protein